MFWTRPASTGTCEDRQVHTPPGRRVQYADVCASQRVEVLYGALTLASRFANFIVNVNEALNAACRQKQKDDETRVPGPAHTRPRCPVPLWLHWPRLLPTPCFQTEGKSVRASTSGLRERLRPQRRRRPTGELHPVAAIKGLLKYSNYPVQLIRNDHTLNNNMLHFFLPNKFIQIYSVQRMLE